MIKFVAVINSTIMQERRARNRRSRAATGAIHAQLRNTRLLPAPPNEEMSHAWQTSAELAKELLGQAEPAMLPLISTLLKTPH